MYKLFSILLSLWCVMLPTFVVAAGNTKTAVSEADRQKAEYLFEESIVHHALGNSIEADQTPEYELLKRAYELDPDNVEVGYYYGLITFMFERSQFDDARRNLSIELIKRYAETYPTSYYENLTAAEVCFNNGRVDDAIAIISRLVDAYPEKLSLYKQLADCYIAKTDFAKAVEMYDKIESHEGHSIELSVYKASLYYMMRDTSGMIGECRKLLRGAPDNKDYNRLMGDMYAKLGQFGNALAYYQRVDSLDPEDGMVNLVMADIYRAQGDTTGTFKEIGNAVLRDNNFNIDNKTEILKKFIVQMTYNMTIDSMSVQPDTIISFRENPRIDSLLRRTIDQYPTDESYRELYAWYLYGVGNFEATIEQYRILLSADPEDNDYRKMMMFCYVNLDEKEKAVAVGEDAIRVAPDDLSMYQYLIQLYALAHKFGRCFELYDELMARNDTLDVINKAEIYTTMGDVCLESGDRERANSFYEKSIELEPDNMMTLNNYAYNLCCMNKDLDKAEAMSRKAIEAEPENAIYLDTYAWVCFTKHDYKQALVYIEAAIEALKSSGSTTDGEFFEHYGDILFMNGEPDKAVEQWKRALELKPDSDLLKRKVEHKTYFYE